MSCDVSVVVPMYNARELVKFTVDSILNQTLADIEVLIVDDCSTDDSLEFCRTLYGQNQRVRILQQPHNMGPGAARNTGIRSAQGKYVAFVDSDDEILPDMFSKMLDIAQQYDADVIHPTQFVYALPDEEGNIPLQLVGDSVQYFRHNIGRDSYAEVTRVTDDIAERFEDWKNRKINWSVCGKMLRRDFLLNNNIFFPEMKYAEDMIFCFACLFKTKNYVIMPGGGYVIRTTASSLTRGKSSSVRIITGMESQLKAISSMKKIFEGIPFFAQNPDKAVSAVERVVDDLELSYIRPAYQKLGEETLRSDKPFHDFMLKEFGSKTPYVEFLFYELHRLYEPVIDYIALSGDIESFKSFTKSLREKESNK